MTIEIVPAAGSRWRHVYPVPKDVALENGPWCSMDRGAGLIPEHHGWVCASCGAWWDQFGRNGRWLTASSVLLVDGRFVERDEPAADAGRLRRVDRAATGVILAGVVLGGGFAAGRAMHEHADVVPEDLVWAVGLLAVGVLLIAVGLVCGWNWWLGRQDLDGSRGCRGEQ